MALWDENVQANLAQYVQSSQQDTKVTYDQMQVSRLKERVSDLESELRNQKNYTSNLLVDMKLLRERANNSQMDYGQAPDSSIEIQNLEATIKNQRDYYER
mmetsp:Transcript_42610/g.40886  ORF Transcript_42610/g.40886 Transcript_42610/m.40886 type:complete len:101 (+) Transcript_42610:1626-1928(+)